MRAAWVTVRTCVRVLGGLTEVFPYCYTTPTRSPRRPKFHAMGSGTQSTPADFERKTPSSVHLITRG